MRVLCIFALLLLAVIAWAQAPLTYTAIRSDVPPELRGGRTFVPVRVISEQFGATVRWQPQGRQVTIERPNAPTIHLTIGSTSTQVGERAVTLDAAPYTTSGRTMVPMRFIAESYGIPVAYHAATATVRLTRENRLYILSLPSTRAGVTIETPAPNALVRNPILVQGVGNVFEGHLEIEVRDARGGVLSHTFATAGMGAFYPYSTTVYYNNPSDDAIDGRIVVFSRNGRGDSQILAQASIPVRLASTR